MEPGREFLGELLAQRSELKGTLRLVTDVIHGDSAEIAAGEGGRVASLIPARKPTEEPVIDPLQRHRP